MENSSKRYRLQNNQVLQCKLTEEGLIVDLEESSGEVVGTYSAELHDLFSLTKQAAQFKRYYHNDGYPQYDTNNDLIADVAKGLETIYPFDTWKDEKVFKLMYQTFINVAAGLKQSYSIKKSMPGMGGGSTIEEWRNEIGPDDFKYQMKRLFFDFIDQGFPPFDFYEVAISAVCRIQLTYMI